MAAGYAPATINHTLAVLASFYAFHARFGQGPVDNPVPENSGRRARLAHRSPLEVPAEFRRAPLRQRAAVLTPRSIPDELVDELFATLRTSRDRALVALFLSTGARASELLGAAVTGSTGLGSGSGWCRRAAALWSRFRRLRRRCGIWRRTSTSTEPRTWMR